MTKTHFWFVEHDTMLSLMTIQTLNSKIPLVSVTNARSDSYSSGFPYVLRKYKIIAQADLICLSQMPPMWLAAGWFLTHFIQSRPWPCINDWIFWFSISSYAFFNSFSQPIKLGHCLKKEFWYFQSCQWLSLGLE